MATVKTQQKIDWDRNNAMFLTLKLMRKSESDLVTFLESIEKGKRNTIIKQALREYMERHSAEMHLGNKEREEA